MLFKNLVPYLLTSNSLPYLSYTEEQWKDKLSEFEFSPCQPTDVKKIGWLSDKMVFVNEAILLTIKKEEKLLPNEVIKQELEDKIEEKELGEGRKLKKTEKQTLKDAVMSSLLPRAFSRFTYQYLIIDLSNNMIYVNSGFSKQSEDILAFLRKTLETLPVIPVSFKKTLSTELRSLLLKESLIPEIGILNEFELTSDDGVISCKETSIEAEKELRQVVEHKEVSKIGINFNDVLTLTVCENGLFKKLKFVGEEKNSSDEGDLSNLSKEEKEILTQQEDLILMSSTFRNLFDIFDLNFEIQKGEK